MNNTPPCPRFEPVAPLMRPNNTELHASSRTSFATRADAHGRKVAVVTTSRMRMHVEDGQLRIAFTRSQLMTPPPRTARRLLGGRP